MGFRGSRVRISPARPALSSLGTLGSVPVVCQPVPRSGRTTALFAESHSVPLSCHHACSEGRNAPERRAVTFVRRRAIRPARLLAARGAHVAEDVAGNDVPASGPSWLLPPARG